MRKVDLIVIHCSAGYSDITSMYKYWKNTLGWKTGGYHRIIDLEGKVNKEYDFDKVTNGVAGWNSRCIHICYIGGVEKGNPNKALDSRTQAQKDGIIEAIVEALNWIKTNQGDYFNVRILGHRDLSPDLNNNDIIDPNERIKMCPSFDAIPEYRWMVETLDNKNDKKLPTK